MGHRGLQPLEGAVSDERDAINTLLRHALSGHDAHVRTSSVFDGLDWKLAGQRPQNAPHSAYQLLWHMVYWQEWDMAWLGGKRPAMPTDASGSWPDTPAPPDRQAWKRELRRFQTGLRKLDRHACDANLLRKHGGRSGLDWTCCRPSRRTTATTPGRWSR
jgi:hypothetical protein